MNKKLNTIIFMIGATILNLILLIVCALLLIWLFSLIYKNVENISTALSWLTVMIILFGSIAATFVLYMKIIKWIVKKWNLENYIEPIFRSRKR